MALRDIIAKFGFDYDKGSLAAVHSGVEGAKGAVVGLVGSLAGLFALHKLKEFFNDIAAEAAGLGKVAQQTGNSIDQVEFLLFAMPVPAEAAEQALRKFTIAMGRSEEGAGKQSEAFTKLGISLKDASGEQRSSGDVLEDVVRNFDKIPDAGAKAAVAVDLFGKAGVQLIPLLNKGEAGLAALHEEFEQLGGGFGEEAVVNAQKYKKALKNLDLALDSLKGKVAGPVFEWLAGAFKTVAKGVGWFNKMTQQTNLLKATLITLGVAGAIGVGMLLAPFAPVIAAVTTLSLIFDDLLVFLEGGESVIGKALNAMFGEGTATTVRDSLNHIGEVVAEFFTDLLKEPRKFVDETKKIFDDLLSFGQKGEVAKVASKATGTDLTDRGIVNSVLGKGAGDWLFGPQGQPAGGAPAQGPGFGLAGNQNVGVPQTASLPSDDWFAKLSNALFGASQTIAPMTAALPPGAAPVSNEVNQQNRTTIIVNADTPKEVTAAVEDGVTKGDANNRRNALLTLDQRAP